MKANSKQNLNSNVLENLTSKTLITKINTSNYSILNRAQSNTQKVK